MVKRALCSCFVPLMLVVSGSVAHAEADPSEALRQLGKKAFAAKDYKKAAANFEKVYRLLMLQKKRDRNQWISVHWALARAYAKLGKCEKALRFIKGVPKDVTDRAARARKTRATLERTCHKALLHQAAKTFHCAKVRNSEGRFSAGTNVLATKVSGNTTMNDAWFSTSGLGTSNPMKAITHDSA